MTDLDLQSAIVAAARAMWDHTFEDGFWDSMTHDGENAQHCLLNAELALRAALPLLRERLAREIEAARTDRRDAAEDAFLTWRDGMEEAAALVRGGTTGGHDG